MSGGALPGGVANVAARYRNVQAATVSPAKLVLLLLEGVIRFAGEAQEAMRRGDRARAGERIHRTHAILEQLAGGLDMSDDTGLCENLMGVYSFCMRRLVEANLKQDPNIVGEVPTAIAPIRDGWSELLSGTR